MFRDAHPPPPRLYFGASGAGTVGRRSAHPSARQGAPRRSRGPRVEAPGAVVDAVRRRLTPGIASRAPRVSSSTGGWSKVGYLSVRSAGFGRRAVRSRVPVRQVRRFWPPGGQESGTCPSGPPVLAAGRSRVGYLSVRSAGSGRRAVKSRVPVRQVPPFWPPRGRESGRPRAARARRARSRVVVPAYPPCARSRWRRRLGGGGAARKGEAAAGHAPGDGALFDGAEDGTVAAEPRAAVAVTQSAGRWLPPTPTRRAGWRLPGVRHRRPPRTCAPAPCPCRRGRRAPWSGPDAGGDPARPRAAPLPAARPDGAAPRGPRGTVVVRGGADEEWPPVPGNAAPG
jgi:hypothetical protein